MLARLRGRRASLGRDNLLFAWMKEEGDVEADELAVRKSITVVTDAGPVERFVKPEVTHQERLDRVKSITFGGEMGDQRTSAGSKSKMLSRRTERKTGRRSTDGHHGTATAALHGLAERVRKHNAEVLDQTAIDPVTRGYRLWVTLMCVLSFYQACEACLQVAFRAQYARFHIGLPLTWCIDLFFVADVVLSTRVGYFDGGEKVWNSALPCRASSEARVPSHRSCLAPTVGSIVPLKDCLPHASSLCNRLWTDGSSPAATRARPAACRRCSLACHWMSFKQRAAGAPSHGCTRCFGCARCLPGSASCRRPPPAHA